MRSDVRVWEETVTLPTYEVGPEDPNPMFLEKRVYQGSSGAVYPYGVIDTLTGQKQMKPYQAIWLENDFIKVMLLPELGGRIHRAYDKVMQRDFVYYNEVIKPALVGLVGPWISGGIEFNWPQHHRPTTFMPVDFTIQEREGGARTVWLGEVEAMRGLQVMAGFTLYPDRALIEITGKVFNGNDTPRHFLWWSNPAVKGGDDHQSVFPPDVTAVYDHGKRDVSAFPIARGTYYKVDYSSGVDISRYRNIPVPTSYMADKSDYDFVGAYSHDEQGGLLHVADHHVSPGKKQWTWGNCDFGLAWDRNLTDDNGPYIELMTGVYTDNQPDFTWLDAGEEKVFVQHFLPYNTLGTVQNANTRAALKLERTEGGFLCGAYAVAPLSGARVEVSDEHGVLFTKALELQPGQAWLEESTASSEGRLRVSLLDEHDQTILSYLEHQPAGEALPDPATAPAPAANLDSVDELYFIGQHLEQYLHASRSPFDYYLRALEIDSGDYRCNLALATLEYNRANYEQALEYANRALARAHRLNKNPQCGKGSLLRAHIEERLGRLDAAFDDFHKATWSGNCRDSGFFGLARIAMVRRDPAQALQFVERSLAVNGTHYGAIALKGLALLECGEREAAFAYLDEQQARHPLHYQLALLRWLGSEQAADLEALARLCNGRGVNLCFLATALLELERPELARQLLQALPVEENLPLLFQASLQPQGAQQEALLRRAEQALGRRVRFPNTLGEVAMLERLPHSWFARYLLGCFHYSKRNYQQAVALWQSVCELAPEFAAAWRNLGIHHFNKGGDLAAAEQCLSRAFALKPDDARLLFELDQLHKRCAMAPAERLALLEAHREVALKRDDLTAELLSLYHITGQLEAAAEILRLREFHPWEGGEGKVTGQYLINQQHRALALMTQGRHEQAVPLLQQALHYPLNLGEGRLVGQTDNDIHYLLALCHLACDDQSLASQCLQQACLGQAGLGASRYYNDQPVDYLFYRGMALTQLGRGQEAERLFEGMVAWAEEAMKAPVEADFFAVSLPDLIVLDDDPQQQHRQHCLLVRALGQLGLGQRQACEQTLGELLTLNPAHDKGHLFTLICRELVLTP
ncbi:hypothetical protein VAWG006_26880 [Aeromonas enteropelogenes]|uniref:DUF5107 domain-containing protein n=1 Tax=Aeromonas sp. 19NY04SH05-1 TaxID=2920537 RepID=A0AAU6T5J4_9GAMM|nr:hypothetical protein VAWG006_26880 [Aeromonas enteropelogenes]BEE22597.1 hypothetical protein VAWG007_26920 [Aeromonas enteropelogenes]